MLEGVLVVGDDPDDVRHAAHHADQEAENVEVPDLDQHDELRDTPEPQQVQTELVVVAGRHVGLEPLNVEQNQPRLVDRAEDPSLLLGRDLLRLNSLEVLDVYLEARLLNGSGTRDIARVEQVQGLLHRVLRG